MKTTDKSLLVIFLTFALYTGVVYLLFVPLNGVGLIATFVLLALLTYFLQHYVVTKKELMKLTKYLTSNLQGLFPDNERLAIAFSFALLLFLPVLPAIMPMLQS